MRASILPIKSNEKPGTIIGTGYGFTNNGTGVCVATRDDTIWVTKIEDVDGIVYSNQNLFELGLKGVFENE